MRQLYHFLLEKLGAQIANCKPGKLKADEYKVEVILLFGHSFEVRAQST